MTISRRKAGNDVEAYNVKIIEIIAVISTIKAPQDFILTIWRRNVMKREVSLFLCSILLMVAVGNVYAGPTEERLTVLEALVAAQQVTIGEQQIMIADLSAQLTEIQNNPVMVMGNYVHVDPNELNGVRGPHVIFEGVNLHVRSGAGATVDWMLDGFGNPMVTESGYYIPSGLGNLIIGYNEIPSKVGNELQPGDRSGSHNLILGREHKFKSSDSILHGWGSTVDWGAHASAIIAGDGTSIGDSYSAAVGGHHHTLVDRGVIIGGEQNTLYGFQAVIVGGQFNTTAGMYSLVAGGQTNQAQGDYSSISGGLERTAAGLYDWAAGSLWEDY